MATTIAPVQDGELTAKIYDDLVPIDLAPAEHAVDAAYVSPAQIERAHRVHGITLLGPIVPMGHPIQHQKEAPASVRSARTPSNNDQLR
ncbi:hypothetical protein OG985_46300 [Streptomyces sp. NBC_00289]|uniref:hypothetical protein n=1 Tax=Streptomyces sp. NBC_00289 TaxID=2975703 RepID=UPI00325008C7